MCVVSLEEVNITPGNVPYELCREIRTDEGGIRQKLDYVIVPASAAIIGAVIVSVIVFIVCLKSSQRKRKGKVSLGTLIYLKITQNVSFEFFNFGIFHQFLNQ